MTYALRTLHRELQEQRDQLKSIEKQKDKSQAVENHLKIIRKRIGELEEGIKLMERIPA